MRLIFNAWNRSPQKSAERLSRQVLQFVRGISEESVP
jgi:hypothetical protein